MLTQAHAQPSSQLGSVSAQVSSGRYFSCALDTFGAVQCWGANDHGQLGTASITHSAQPLPVGLPAAAVTVVTGRSHACALLADGSVACWGANEQGQLGDGSTADHSTATAVGGLPRRVAALVAGERHTCALDTAGAVFCWGANDSGQLAQAASGFVATPQRVGGLERALALAAGGRHSCAATIGGSTFCWGDNSNGQLGSGTAFSSATPQAVLGLSEATVVLAAGDAHTCALGASGSAYCWGHNGSGQLGDGSLNDRATAAAVSGGSLAHARVVSLSAGFAHTCAALDNDEVDCWGDNNDGELGDGSTVEQLWPTAVAAGPFVAGANVSAGFSHTCAKSPTGGVSCWGSNGYGELGNGSLVSSPRPGAVGGHAGAAVAVTGSYQHFCSVTDDGAVQCWGANHAGELGSGVVGGGALVNAPHAVQGLSGPALAVSAGTYHSCAVLRSGGVQCWGFNSDGQLGNASNADSPVPVDVAGLLAPAVAVSAGENFTCALLDDGRLMCWGGNEVGQLGNGSKQGSTVPGLVTGLTGAVRAVSAGDEHVCAALADQTLVCWGSNVTGQLGIGNTTDQSVPTPVLGLSGPVAANEAAVAASATATCAVMADHTVQCWGFDQSVGQLGQGSMFSGVRGPSTVVDLVDALTIAKGTHYFCATQEAGGASCWGDGVNGALGNGQRNDTATPTAILGLSGEIVAISGSYQASCAVRRSGDLYCWGDNSSGQLGLGYTGGDTAVQPSSVLLGQRIVFSVPGALTVGDPPATLLASASSGEAVTFDTWTPDTCTVSGNTVVALAPALCGIRALQAGNGVFAPAPPAYALVPVGGVPQFDVAKASDVAAPLLGQTITYGIFVRNDGTDSGSADLHDDLPASVGSYDAAHAECATTGDAAVCLYTVQCDSVCHLSASVTLPAGGSATLRIPVRALALGDASNTVSLTPTSPICQTRACGAGSASTGPVTIGAAPNFTQEKSIDSSRHVLGDTVVYTIDIANTGTVAGSARWQDVLPAALTNAIVACTTSGTGALCDAGGSSANEMEGNVTLPPGGSATVTITATAAAVGDITNSVQVTPTTPGCNAPAPAGSGNCGGGSATTVAATVSGARLTLQAALGAAGRLAANDQFLLTIAGSAADQVATTGSGGAVTSRAAGVLADAGTNVTLGEAMLAGSDSPLERYAPQLACSNALSPANGGTDASTLRLNAPIALRAGDRIDCVVANGGAAATLTLHQQLLPAGDPGRFVLRVDSTQSASLGDGGSFGPLTLDAGTHTIALGGAAGTVPGQYSVTYACIDAVSRTAVSSGSGTSGSIALAAGQHVDCTFSTRYAHSRLLGALGGARQYAQFGHTLTYLVEIANDGGVAAAAAHVASPLDSAFDLWRTGFVCVATPPASCTAQAAGVLSDTPTLPPGSHVSYVITAGLLTQPSRDRVHQSVVYGATSDAGTAQELSADTQLVVFRDSFEPGGDGSQWQGDATDVAPWLAFGTANVDLSPTLRALARGSVSDVARTVASDGGEARVQAVRLADTVLLRFLAASADGTETAGEWLHVDARNPIVLLGRAGTDVVLTDGAGAQVALRLSSESATVQLQVAQ